MKTIYLVSGRTGAYEDETDWIVCAFSNQTAARERVEELRLILSSIIGNRDGQLDYADRIDIEERMRCHPRGDKHFKINYNGVEYKYFSTDLMD